MAVSDKDPDTDGPRFESPLDCYLHSEFRIKCRQLGQDVKKCFKI
jgi:hypothetical protein